MGDFKSPGIGGHSLNPGLTVYHPRIEDFKSHNCARLASIF
jgi:hypothetical protein